MNIFTIIRQKWSELLLGQFTARDTAFGVTIGTFIALLPTFGFSFLLALLFMALFPRTNRPAIFLAIMIWNPLVQIPIYALSYQLGSMLFEGLPVIKYNLEILNQLYSFTRRFLVAHVIITAVLSICMYCITYAVFTYYSLRKLI